MLDLAALHTGDPHVPLKCAQLIAAIKTHGYDFVMSWAKSRYSDQTIDFVKQVCKLK